jgi:hypothetical protein
MKTPPPSEDQVANLDTMLGLLSGCPAAEVLARSLWECFRYRVSCTLCPDDGNPSTHSVCGIRSPADIGPIAIAITVRRSGRATEALVHELLHARLIAGGYPIFWIDEQIESEKWNLAAGIINGAEHVVMRPLYLAFGLHSGRFLGPSKPLRIDHERIVQRLEAAESGMSMPEGFLRIVSTELQAHDIAFTPLDVSAHIGLRTGRA